MASEQSAMGNDQMILSLDYELFFGSKPGTVKHCMIQPTDALIDVLSKYGAKLSLFVDAGFLVKLRQEASGRYSQLGQDWSAIKSQLQRLSELGHDIQLHIHPHWEDSSFDGQQWKVVTKRYRLHDFSKTEMHDIVRKYKSILEDISLKPVFAYRAGGWCIQPFNEISAALAENAIWLDSTVFENGISEDPVRWFQFPQLPKKLYWRFENDPTEENNEGRFVEIPISSYPLNPLFYWKMAVRKKLSKQQYVQFGDGGAMKANAGYYITRLLKTVPSPVAIDGIKAQVLEDAFAVFQQNNKCGGQIFNVMGHPKSLTPYSLERLDAFLKNHRDLEFVTFQDFVHLKPLGAQRAEEALK